MPINRSNTQSSKSLILFVLTIGITLAMSARSGWSQTILTYSQHPNQQKMSSILKSPSGVTYRLFLSPEFDTDKHTVVLELMLQQLKTESNDTNLLDSTGKLHGYQPYIFAASDFSRGSENSIFGEMRTITLDGLKMKVFIKVKDVSTSPTTSSSHTQGYQFDALTLEITDEATKGSSKNPTP